MPNTTLTLDVCKPRWTIYWPPIQIPGGRTSLGSPHHGSASTSLPLTWMGTSCLFSTTPNSPIAKFLAFWQLNHACGHYLQALTPDTRLTVMLRFYPAPDTRSIIGSFRSFAADIASASDQLLGREELAERVKRARKKPIGNLQWGNFCGLLRLLRDPDRHCAQTLLCFLAAWDSA